LSRKGGKELAAQNELRVAVGNPIGRRSTVWKFFVRGNDVYIFSRMFGAEAKVSLHASGQSQWSATSAWVQKKPARTNADRHFHKWSTPWPEGREAVHVFQIRIPTTELRKLTSDKKLNDVLWLSPPREDQTTSLECYFSTISDGDPVIVSNPPYPCIASFPLADGRWFAVLNNTVDLNGRDLDHLRHAIYTKAKRHQVRPAREQRAVALTISEKGVRGFIEWCLRPEVVRSSEVTG